MKEEDALDQFRRDAPAAAAHIDKLRIAGKILTAEDSISDDDEVLIVGGYGHAQIDGSQQRLCSTCGRVIWISPSSQALLRTHAMVNVLCLDCAKPHLPEGVLLKP